ncbi:hypothetical protein GGR51DRAFT_568304 [Nemania sp. FL0031]|nr:hypothetical protein GGR51DRAFT_568304 [Nemania sp. FL0031]
MYFTKSVSAFLVGALLATSALGDLQVPRRAAEDIVAREQKLERARKRASDCSNESAKKRALLSARDNKLVDSDSWDAGSGQDELLTVGLATCYGVAVVGNGGIGEDRFLSHSYSEDDSPPALEMLQAVIEAKNDGLSQLRSVLIYPDPNSYDNDRDKQEVQDEINNYIGALNHIGGSVTAESHDWRDPWGLKISSNKRITYGSDVHF